MKNKILVMAAIALTLPFGICAGQSVTSNSAKDEMVSLEKAFAEAIKARDSVQASQLQADSYFLAIGIQDGPIQIVSKSQWLSNLKYYVTESYSIDDIKVNVYNNTAVIVMLFTQKATVRGQDRSAQFLITDIWNKGNSGWKISERHSSRPEQRSVARPK